MRKTRVTRRSTTELGGNGRRTVTRCARCSAELRAIPRIVQGAIPIRCERCFGAAPRTEGISLGDWLERSTPLRYVPQWSSEDAEELADAA